MTETFCIDYPETDSGRKSWNKLYGMNAIYAGKHWSLRRQDADDYTIKRIQKQINRR